MEPIHYIYCYTNTINGKKYIGRTINISQRKNQHKADSKSRKTTFYCAIRKYGYHNFLFEILEETYAPQERETHYIREYKTLRPHGYNSKEHDTDMTAEIRHKIGMKNKGKIRSESHRHSISNAQKGVQKSSEHKQKISESHVGIKHSMKTKEKLAGIFAQEWIIIYPDGHTEVIKNLNAFAKKHGLSNMYKVASGKQENSKGYKVMRVTS